MVCLLCASSNLAEFSAEISLRFQGLKNLHEPNVMVFPKTLVCLDCGFSSFTTPKPELRFLSTGNSDGSIVTWGGKSSTERIPRRD